jgi:phospholipid/cholesterol/gamma-HCH transport system substrate-binding protein
LKWSQLKVGTTVIAASITLGVLIFLMSGTGGFLTPKIKLKTYFDNAGGLRVGAPVRLNGVDIGNVTGIQIVPDKDKFLTPVEVTMKVSTRYHFNLRQDSVTLLATAGVLGETYIDIDSSQAKAAEVQDGAVLSSHSVPDFQNVVRASQGTLQNLDSLIKRLDRIVTFVESGNGSVGKLIYDPSLFNQLNTTVSEFQKLVNQVSGGSGTLGKLVGDDELYRKANTAVDSLTKIIDDLNAGKGSAGKLLKDPELYNNANETIANVRKLTDDVNAGKGALGKLTKDPEFANKLQDTINKISAITDRLEAGEGSAGMLLKDPALFNNTNQLLVESRELIKAVRENPKKYLTITLKVF